MRSGHIISQVSRIREKANRFIESELRARNMSGIVPAHGAVLGFLLRQPGPVALKLVVEHTRRAKSTITVMVNNLVKHGYIERTPCPDDARYSLISVTPKARALSSDFEEITQKMLHWVFGEMPLSDREQLMTLLEQLERNMDSHKM